MPQMLWLQRKNSSKCSNRYWKKKRENSIVDYEKRPNLLIWGGFQGMWCGDSGCPMCLAWTRKLWHLQNLAYPHFSISLLKQGREIRMPVPDPPKKMWGKNHWYKWFCLFFQKGEMSSSRYRYKDLVSLSNASSRAVFFLRKPARLAQLHITDK